MEKDKLFSWYSLALVVIGVGINYGGAQLALHYGWPLFLDSVGTILIAALGGYLPGIFVGFLSNYLNSLSDSITLYYGTISILFAIMAAFMSARGAFRRIDHAVFASLPFAAVGGVLGSLMTWALYGLSFGSGISAPFALLLYDSTTLSKFTSQLIADAGIDLVDKFATMLIVYIVLRLLPRGLLARLPLGHVYLRDAQHRLLPLDRRAQRAYRSASLRHKVAALIIITSIILGGTAVTISFLLYQHRMNDHYFETGSSATALMAQAIDGDDIDRYLEQGERNSGYLEVKAQLETIRTAIPEIKYMYVYQVKPDGCHVVFDLDTPDTPAAATGEVIAFDESYRDYVPALLRGEPIPPVIAYGQYGWLLTVYQPLYDSAGRCSAYAAADIDMQSVIADRYVYIIRMVSLLFAASILLISLTVWFAQNKIVMPLNALAVAANKFAYESESDRQQNRDRLQELGIKTGDEIENLYSAITKTTADVTKYINEINDKTAQLTGKAKEIALLQENTILSFANLAESRDENTGHHIKRTAAYVRVIAQALYNQRCYTPPLSPKLIDDIARSAPLHDIGKIKTPDAILNKPGRLTPEEFEVIKKHTTAGREVLRGVMSGIDEDSYLHLASDMAAYHHERWDGGGYPDGLRGEQIPLGARIMAIADVFDALVSKRSYKEAFPFDEAIDIIRADSGSHFDPQVVEAFISNLPQIRRITESN